MKDFVPRLDILPPSQRLLWDELGSVPSHFVLYGGTAIALRLGHRISEDFDFFSSTPFVPGELSRQMPFLSAGTLLQSEPNTLTMTLERGGPVKISFFGGLTFGRASEPDQVPGSGIWVASLLDLAATKARVVIERAERKDYLDLAALFSNGISLGEALGAAQALYGESFNPIIVLKALSYFEDGDLPGLPQNVKQALSKAAAELVSIPTMARSSDRISPA